MGIIQRLFLGFVGACLAFSASSLTPAEVGGLSFTYERGKQSSGLIRIHTAALKPMRNTVYVYVTIGAVEANPIPYVDNVPQWQPAAGTTGGASVEDLKAMMASFWSPQPRRPFPKGQPRLLETVALGEQSGKGFVPLIRLGLANDGRALEMADVTAWVSDGAIDYFGPVVRPQTPYDFKLKLDMAAGRMTAWVSGRGDDDWFLLAEDVKLSSVVRQLNHVQVEQYPDGPAVEGLRVRLKPWDEGERVRPHPLAKRERVVGPGGGFRFQSMRSAWRKPGKQVVVFRKPGVHAAFPDVAEAEPGHLICVWRNGSHTGGTGGLSVAHSYDLGQTWSEPILFSSLRANCPRIQRLKDGTVLLLADVGSGTGGEESMAWDMVFWDSHDGGRTWHNERWLKPATIGGPSALVPSRVTELSDGSWLLSASSFLKRSPGEADILKLEFYRSTDHGATWQYWPGPMAYPPYSSDEPSTLQLPDGHLLTYARESRVDGMPGAKGYSPDAGRSWTFHDLPFSIVGRTCADWLKDGRVMMTFRADVGRDHLWAWIGEAEDMTSAQPAGIHYNDSESVGLRDGALHIDNDGRRGQFTMYNLRPLDSSRGQLEITFEVKVLANEGRAATVSVPFAGKLRLFPSYVVMAHEPSLRVAVTPGQFHTYRIISRSGRMALYVDGQRAFDTDKATDRRERPGTSSRYGLSFGNEPGDLTVDNAENPYQMWPEVLQADISSEVTGYSIWRRFETIWNEPAAGRRAYVWSAERDGFPDQYQLDHMVEVDASVSGCDQGYSGWVQLEDGRIFVVNYTDDTSAASIQNPFHLGVPWIRGTWLTLGDLPPVSKNPKGK
jgi:hypothetical protein